MNGPTTHFPPSAAKLSRAVRAGAPPVVSIWRTMSSGSFPSAAAMSDTRLPCHFGFFEYRAIWMREPSPRLWPTASLHCSNVFGSPSRATRAWISW